MRLAGHPRRPRTRWQGAVHRREQLHGMAAGSGQWSGRSAHLGAVHLLPGGLLAGRARARTRGLALLPYAGLGVLPYEPLGGSLLTVSIDGASSRAKARGGRQRPNRRRDEPLRPGDRRVPRRPARRPGQRQSRSGVDALVPARTVRDALHRSHWCHSTTERAEVVVVTRR